MSSPGRGGSPLLSQATARRIALRGVAVVVVGAALTHARSDGKLQLASTLAARLPRVAPEPLRPLRDWSLVGGKSWELVATNSEDTEATDTAEGTRGSCAAGMVEVRGQMKMDGPKGPVEWLQREACVDWIAREFPERCARYDADRWRDLSLHLPTRAMHFCIDRFEYPNQKGSYPVIMVTWHEASALCDARGERLCSEDEWTFACEGEEALPFATGYARDPTACAIDRPWRFVREAVLAERTSPAALRAVDDLWQGQASGAMPACRSPFGVYDMIGNVDEWTRSVERKGLRSILKGGYWGPVRTQCRVSTRVHDEDFFFYQIGFRCCADAAEPPAAAPAQVEPGQDGQDAGGATP